MFFENIITNINNHCWDGSSYVWCMCKWMQFMRKTTWSDLSGALEKFMFFVRVFSILGQVGQRFVFMHINCRIVWIEKQCK